MLDKLTKYKLAFFAVLAIVAGCTDFKEEDVLDGLEVDTSTLAFLSGGDSRTLRIHSGAKWSVSSLPEWLSVQSISTSSSAFDWTVTISAAANNEYDREDVVVVKANTETVTVDVSQDGKKGKYIPVESISIAPTELALTVGETAILTYIIKPSNASVKSVSWESSSPSIASVSSSGLVEAIAEGTTLITVTTDDGSKIASCELTVKARVIHVTGVGLDKIALTMLEGESQTLIATVSPSNATDKSVTWSSSNTSIATVSSDGIVTAKAAGSATITVTTNDGGKTATCLVTVKAKTVSVTGVSLNMTSLTMTEGDSQTLIATVQPSNATDKSVTWSSNNTSVANVSSSGVVSAKAAGSTTITVKTNDGAKTATCVVRVNSVWSIDGSENGHDYVDLGLPSGLKWATCNVGASKPEEYGNYYAWGETSTKDEYRWTNYKFRTSGSYDNDVKFSKYNTDSSRGTVDNKTILELSDDAARANWGGSWRMPTTAEFDELKANCTYTWTAQSGVNGYKVTGKNGKSIFLPAAGTSSNYVGSDGFYWSASLCRGFSYLAWRLGFGSSYFKTDLDGDRCFGRSVRPVME